MTDPRDAALAAARETRNHGRAWNRRPSPAGEGDCPTPPEGTHWLGGTKGLLDAVVTERDRALKAEAASVRPDATSPGACYAGARDAELVAMLRETLQAMASLASVPMDLWDRHSNAALNAAARLASLSAEVERLKGSLQSIREVNERYEADAKRYGAQIELTWLRLREAERQADQSEALRAKAEAALAGLAETNAGLLHSLELRDHTINNQIPVERASRQAAEAALAAEREAHAQDVRQFSELADANRRRAEAAEAPAARMREALEQAEACMAIVEPRSDKAEYVRILGVIRTALQENIEGTPARGWNTRTAGCAWPECDCPATVGNREPIICWKHVGQSPPPG